MAEFTGPNYGSPVASGEHGNARVLYLTYEATGEAAASTLKLGRLPGGALVYDVVLLHDDLGTNSLDLGYRYRETDDGTSDLDYWFDGQDTGSAAERLVSSAWPVEIAKGAGVDVVATANSGAITGTIGVLIKYDWIGQ